MALQTSKMTDQGFNCPEFYMIISELTYNKDNNTVGALLGFKDKQARIDGLSAITRQPFAFPYDINSSVGIIEQAYVFLKGLPELSGCIDA